MDFCFALVAIFLTFDVVSVQSTDNGCSKKIYSNKVKFSKQSSSINPFQVSINHPNTQDNSFNPLNCNENKNPKSIAAQAFNIAFSNNNHNPFPKNKKNPFLNYIKTNSSIEFPNSPVTQTSAPITSAPNISVNTPAPENDLTYIPPKIHPPISRSLLEKPIEINPVKTISERKCEEYAKEIAGTTLVTFLTGSSSDVREVINNYESENRLVSNGIEAQVGEFPYMVALGRCNDKNCSSFDLWCGGVLISHTWALSAAHCSHRPNGGPTVAKIGFHNLTEQGNVIPIDIMIRHPNYRPPLMYEDIALVKLNETVTFGRFIRPACLYQQYDIEIKEAWISGWGRNETDAIKHSNSLLKAKLDLIDNQNCREKYPTTDDIPHGITSDMICAGDPHGNWTRDTCQGDSGGPLQIAHPKNECLFQVIGITSIGQGCATNDIPGVYTRVSHYLSWIEKHVWPQEQ